MFRFKKFHIHHSRSAMKVGTDGVLVGLLATLPVNSHYILDIGTGCGLISLMLNQRFPQCKIIGIDVDKESLLDARQNIRENNLIQKIELYHTSLQEFSTSMKFDLIVSNPPFFTPTHKAGNEKRTLARHSSTLLAEDLFSYAKNLLSKKGEIQIIYPISMAKVYEVAAENIGLKMKRKITIYGTPNKPPKRCFTTWQDTSNEIETLETSNIIIENSRHQYTDEFASLAKPFYIHL